MNKTRQAVENVNFRLYFKVIIRQNETQYFTYSIYTEQESENTAYASPEARDYLKLWSYICMMETLENILTQLVGKTASMKRCYLKAEVPCWPLVLC